MLPYIQEEPPAVVWANLLAQRDENGALKAFTLYSHAAFIFSLAMLIATKRPFEAILNALAFIVSFFYHACLSYDICSGTNVFVERAEDYVTANLQIVVIVSLLVTMRNGRLLVSTVEGGDAFFKIFVPFQILFVTFAVIYQPYSLYIAYVSLAAALISSLAYPLFFRSSPRLHLSAGAYVIEPLAVSMPWFVIFLLSMASAIVLYLIDVNSSWAHSAWHVFAGLGIGFLALAVYDTPAAPMTLVQYETNWVDTQANHDPAAAAIYRNLIRRARQRVRREAGGPKEAPAKRDLLWFTRRATTGRV
jgi:hypothetical protein